MLSKMLWRTFLIIFHQNMPKTRKKSELFNPYFSISQFQDSSLNCNCGHLIKKAPPNFGYFANFSKICPQKPSGVSLERGQSIFKIPEIWSDFGWFWLEKFSDLKNSFAPKSPMPYAIMIHSRFQFYQPNLKSKAESCLGAQNHNI